MPIDAIASRTLLESMRLQTSQTRTRLSEAAAEVASGRHHDLGLALSESVSHLLDMKAVGREIDAITASNGVLQIRLATTERALSAVADLAAGFLSALASVQSSGDREIVVADASARLRDLVGLLSTTSNDAFVFSGLNADVAPLQDYLSSPPGAGRTQVVASFTAEFGFAPTDPQVSGISTAQMASYLDGAHATNFEPPLWNTLFSSATDQAGRQRISTNQVVELPGSANDAGVRRLMAGLAAVVDSGTAGLNSDSFKMLADWATETVGAAVSELTATRAGIGMTQERLAKASAGMNTQSTLLEASIGRLEGVDANEASARLFALNTQLEVSYAVTARLQRLSLLNYL